MSGPVLRTYQQDAILGVLDAWSDSVQRPAVVLPTGAGKTVIFATLCALLARRGHRPLVLVNRDELVRQTIAKLHDADPDLVVGKIQGPDQDLRGHVVVASVQTLSRVKRLHLVEADRFDRIIADECHFAAAESWRRVLEYFGAFTFDSDTAVVGFTATMTRTDAKGLGEVWQDVVFSRSLRWAIDAGFLVGVRAQSVVIDSLSLAEVKTRNGDLAEGDLGKAMAQAKAGPLVAAAYLELARDEAGELRRGICFAPTVETATAFMHEFRAAGIPTELVIGTTPTAERQAKYAATHEGSNKVLMSVGVLTTGFDLPTIEVAVIARPTKSPGLYQQMVGRVLRLSPGKSEALILDVVGAGRLGLASIVDLDLDGSAEDAAAAAAERGETEQLAADLLEVPTELSFQAIDPFSGSAVTDPVRRKILRKRAHIKAWDLTEGGTPFLPPREGFPFYLALHHKPGTDLWAVWEVPKGSGRAQCLAEGLSYAEAVLEALESHPGPPAAMAGAVTEGQLKWRGVVDPGMTKAQASRAISRHLASRRLDA